MLLTRSLARSPSLPHTYRTMSSSTWSRLVRFHPKSSPSTILIGEPVDRELDVGIASYEAKAIEVSVYSGSSVLQPGEKTEKTETVERLLSPLARSEVGTIRCIGLNYLTHAQEMGLETPDVPSVFMKPANSLGDPFPAPTVIPAPFVKDDAADYEAEVALVIGKAAKNVSEEDAMDYLLGFTAANDLSSRLAQFAQSQWCYSKSFDGACPIGPALLNASQVKSIREMTIRGELSGDTVQEMGLHDLIFSVPKIISFLSQGTTLDPGTVILTGTPPGVGWKANPRRMLKQDDEFRVFVSHGVGTLINKIEEEK